MKTESESIIKSKKRVSDHGEVFTNDREINAMLDLVKQETERIDSNFLEPACGDGNFLSNILTKKLDIVENLYKKNQQEFEKYSLLAISSIYGIELLKDNTEKCRKRLFNIFQKRHDTIFSHLNPKLKKSIKFILEKNIIHGDALTLKSIDANCTSITFCEWSLIGNKIKRRDFTFSELLGNEEIRALPLFSDAGEEVIFPTPIREYPLINYLEISTNV
tara:strand:- start:1180 stop:1836 length:657 start_codon:yes stop_codon:yes gene_type:complete